MKISSTTVLFLVALATFKDSVTGPGMCGAVIAEASQQANFETDINSHAPDIGRRLTTDIDGRLFIPELSDAFPNGIIVEKDIDQAESNDWVSDLSNRTAATGDAHDLPSLDFSAANIGSNRRLQTADDDLCGPRQLVHMTFSNPEQFNVTFQLRNPKREAVVAFDAYQVTDADMQSILQRARDSYRGFGIDFVLEPPADVPPQCITTVFLNERPAFDAFKIVLRESGTVPGTFKFRHLVSGESETIDFRNRVRNLFVWADASVYAFAYQFWGDDGLKEHTGQTVSPTLTAEQIIQSAVVNATGSVLIHELGHGAAGLRHHDALSQGYQPQFHPAFPPGHVMMDPTDENKLANHIMSTGVPIKVVSTASFFSPRSAIKVALSLGVDWTSIESRDSQMTDSSSEPSGSGAVVGGVSKGSKAQHDPQSNAVVKHSKKHSKAYLPDSSVDGSSDDGGGGPAFNRHEYILTEHEAKAGDAIRLKKLLIPNSATTGPFAGGDALEASAIAIVGSLQAVDVTNNYPFPVDHDSFTFYFEEGQIITADYAAYGGRTRRKTRGTLQVMSLIDGTMLCENFIGSESGQPLCINMVIPASGEYKVNVRTFSHTYDVRRGVAVQVDPATLEGEYDLLVYAVKGAVDRAASMA